MANTTYLHCIYAEDVRPETSGQVSVIGVFQGGLRVLSVPTQLAKLTVIADLFVPLSRQPPQHIKLEVLRDGEVLQSIEAPSEFVRSAFEKAAEEADAEGVSMQFVLGFAGFPLPGACKVRAHAYVDDELVTGNALKVAVEPTGLRAGDSA